MTWYLHSFTSTTRDKQICNQAAVLSSTTEGAQTANHVLKLQAMFDYIVIAVQYFPKNISLLTLVMHLVLVSALNYKCPIPSDTLYDIFSKWQHTYCIKQS